MRFSVIALAAAVTLGGASLGSAEAKTVTVEVKMTRYGGPGAYLALYLVDAKGAYQETLWIAGSRQRYLRSMRQWSRNFASNPQEIDGITGASVGSGRALKISVELEDALLTSGYQLHVDTSVEDRGSRNNDAVVELAPDASGKPVSGSGFVQSLTATW